MCARSRDRSTKIFGILFFGIFISIYGDIIAIENYFFGVEFRGEFSGTIINYLSFHTGSRGIFFALAPAGDENRKFSIDPETRKNAVFRLRNGFKN